jgi:hypothetical protein
VVPRVSVGDFVIVIAGPCGRPGGQGEGYAGPVRPSRKQNGAADGHPVWDEGISSDYAAIAAAACSS